MFKDTAWCRVAGHGGRPPGGSHSAFRPSEEAGYEQPTPQSDGSDVLGGHMHRGLESSTVWGFTPAFTLGQFN